MSREIPATPFARGTQLNIAAAYKDGSVTPSARLVRLGERAEALNAAVEAGCAARIEALKSEV